MTERGLTTPLQPVRHDRGLGPIAVALALVAVLGVIVWRPWSQTSLGPGEGLQASPRAIAGSDPSASPSTVESDASPDALAESDLFAGPTTGPWSGWVTGEWSIVAFLRSDPVSRDPLNIRQQQVAVFVGPRPAGTYLGAICDAPGTFLHQAAAVLPTHAVHFLGIAFPPDRQVFVDRVSLVGSGPLGARPVEIGRIPGDEAPLATLAPAASPGPTASGDAEPVRMFALPEARVWPDGVYRFDIYTRDGLPAQLFACIRP